MSHAYAGLAALTKVIIFANLCMPYTIEYFNERVLAEIEAWPVGILADYARIVELLVEFGPDLRMPHSPFARRWAVRVAAARSRGHRARVVLLPRR